MKLTCTAFALGALCESAAAALAGVYLYDPLSPPRPQATLDPVTARLVLAQRAGVEDFHGLDLNKQGVVNAINEYGLRTSLFAEEQSRTNKAYILLEGELDGTEIEALRSHSNFQIDPAPTSLDSRSLFIDLAKQSDPKGFLTFTDEEVENTLKDRPTLSGAGDIFYIASSAKDFETVFALYVSKSIWSITGLVTTSNEPSTKSSSVIGRWGTYEMPGQQLPVKRQAGKEKPLTETTPFQSSSTLSSPAHIFANDSKPLRGILPACFHSQAQCVERTNNCTGHGQCKLKFHDKTATVNQDCYSCQCGTTTSSDGKFRTLWGGPACQKKDISVQFWLIVLFSVGMIFLIGFAIGQIWEMGDQELPSVIGAGVSGPTARK